MGIRLVFFAISIVIICYLYLRSTDLPKKDLTAVNVSVQGDLTHTKCPDGPIVSVVYGGRLCNNIWEYASAWVVARTLNRTAYVSDVIYLQLTPFFEQLSLNSLDAIKDCSIDLGPDIPMEEIEQLETLEQRYRGRHILLPAFSQILEPMIPFRELLRNEFKFKPGLWSAVHETIENLNGRGKILIGVHVRRDDFHGFLPKAYHVNVTTATYYKNAMHWYREKINGTKLFLIVSDDLLWCKENLLDQGDVVIASKHAAHDLALMSICNHTIIDYGSFSFWASFLSEGHTISLNVENNVTSVMAEKANWTIFDKDTLMELKKV